MARNKNVSNYSIYLTSPHWQNLKTRLIYRNARSRCFVCGGRHRLELHHVRYDHLYEERLNRDVYVVCRSCHRSQHRFLWVIRLPLKGLMVRLWLTRIMHRFFLVLAQ